MYKKLRMCIVFLLSACTSDPIPDEDFEAPTGGFPLLGTVPERPILPKSEIFTHQRKTLQKEHEEAIQKQDELLKSLRT